MINSEESFKGVGKNIDNAGRGCMWFVLALIILIIYVIAF